MRRRDKTGSKGAKTQRPETLKRRSAPSTARHRNPGATGKETNVARLTRERDEALERLAAASEVLEVVSSSPGELQPVFETILENATRICEAKFANLFLYETNSFRIAAQLNAPPAYAERWRRQPTLTVSDNPQNPLTRVVASKNVVAITDLMAEQGYIDRDPRFVALVESAGARSHLVVPMLKEDELIGAIVIYRQEVHPFTEKEIELVRNFATQAVIAIENTRLLNELRESLQQQTATADVLKVISSSQGDLTHVFESILVNATRICEASFANLTLLEHGELWLRATHGAPAAFADAVPVNSTVPRQTPVGRVIDTGQLVHVADVQADETYGRTRLAKLAGARTTLGVPMLRDGQIIGAILIYRQEVREFTDKQIALVQNFAAQAVIAIENTRLLNELRERTDDLSESLEQQTATSEVLQVISKSPGELEPVFQAMLEKATRVCQASFGMMFRYEDGTAHPVALLGVPQAYVDFIKRGAHRPSEQAPVMRVAKTKQIVHVADFSTEPAYAVERNPMAVAGVEIAGIRALLVVPMLEDDVLAGAIAIYRQEVRPFTEKQIELVTNFAAQAVIAIENTRLLNELRESLQQQTATADVLKVISSSPGDLAPVFKAMLENAVHICEAKFGHMFLSEGEAFRVVALESGTLPYPDWLREGSKLELRANPQGPLAQIAATGKIVHIGDLTAEAPYRERNPRMVALVESSGARTFLGVPMFRGETLMGAIGIYRQEVRPFTDKQIALVQNFAAQAVIAIENSRLLNELRQRTRELAASLEDLRTTQDRLVQTQKLASLGQLTAGIAHEIKNPLNFVNNFSGVSAELIDELQEALKDVNLNEKRRKEINELTNMLRGNLDKVVRHGKRADAIVKNMLLHSREGSGEHRLVDINALVEEGLNLAYHGARAEKQGFAITLERSLDPSAGAADIFPQDITRALLNLILNGFYAATKRRAETNGGDYEPTLTAATRNLGDRVEIRIRDNGTGILPDVKEKIFNPFFTTKPAGEGTGLGLSISHDIIVKQHGGSIEVDTQPGQFTEIRVILPRAAVVP
jgi:two-component system, NtrC family, sensor kinase